MSYNFLPVSFGYIGLLKNVLYRATIGLEIKPQSAFFTAFRVLLPSANYSAIDTK
jgi:hypothetical protein